MGAACFMVAVLALPRFASRPVVDDFLWVYFAVLFLSSILNLGLERLAGPVIARAGDVSTSRAISPLMAGRVCSTPLTAAALWLLFTVVHVRLPITAWWA